MLGDMSWELLVDNIREIAAQLAQSTMQTTVQVLNGLFVEIALGAPAQFSFRRIFMRLRGLCCAEREVCAFSTLMNITHHIRTVVVVVAVTRQLLTQHGNHTSSAQHSTAHHSTA